MRQLESSPVTRRTILAGSLSAVVGCLVSGERVDTRQQKIPTVGAYIVRRETYPEARTVTVQAKDFAVDGAKSALPEHITRTIAPTVAKANQILEPALQIPASAHRLYRINPAEQNLTRKVTLNATITPENGLVFGMLPGIPYGVKRLNRASFHEAMHIFDRQAPLYVRPLVNSDTVTEYFEYCRERQKAIDYGIGKAASDRGAYDRLPIAHNGQLDNAGLFPLFDESSYDGSLAGHPYDGSDELVASGLTVMRYFPKGLIASVETLERNDRRETAHFIGSMLTTGRELAANAQAFDGLFNPQLAAYANGPGLR